MSEEKTPGIDNQQNQPPRMALVDAVFQGMLRVLDVAHEKHDLTNLEVHLVKSYMDMKMQETLTTTLIEHLNRVDIVKDSKESMYG